MARESSGITTSRTAASFPFIRKAMISAPTNIPGARRAIFSPMVSTFCTCWISLVRRVTREPVLNPSMLANENCWTFLNTSLRRSVVKLMDAFAAKYEPRIPPVAMNATTTAMRRPIFMIYPVSPPATPLLMIMDMSFGRATSPATSVSIIRGPMRKAPRYGVIYFL